ncbi:DNA-dependent RNA polymerase subunit 2 RPB2 [Orpheovirus IHUMI-LCC2]|uniref:DNA-directed RNA polymerase n=1 Tax=Orpheovirus IHUMI-LCC2 TaxID=2023057 RepID=A0A2I2L5I0_9VIRU|nr:DNA-dependent RNA polymerase subunit 2 RPB2 [Orpheovirus IHUMI-LCC2]SNW62793.1 DNA-dependent RNA polymerase subunit 2 RPB2 [Orpheovirus IHUMI-LCC2]
MNVKSDSRIKRSVQPSSYGYICPMETPEYHEIGYNKIQTKYILESNIINEDKLNGLKFLYYKHKNGFTNRYISYYKFLPGCQ